MASERSQMKARVNNIEAKRLNIEFQSKFRIKEGNIRGKCKLIQESDRIRSWHVFKDIRGLTGTFHQNMGIIERISEKYI